MEEREGQSIEEEEEMGDEAHKRAQSSLQKKRKCERGRDVCRSRKKRGGE